MIHAILNLHGLVSLVGHESSHKPVSYEPVYWKEYFL